MFEDSRLTNFEDSDLQILTFRCCQDSGKRQSLPHTHTHMRHQSIMYMNPKALGGSSQKGSLLRLSW